MSNDAQERPRTADFATDFSVGGTSAAIVRSLSCPFDNIHRERMYRFRNSRDISNLWSRMYAENGLKFFWRGNLTNVLRYVPLVSLNFAFKEQFQTMLPHYDPTRTIVLKSLAKNICCGGLAGASSFVILYPLDTARAELANDVGTDKRRYKGLVDCLLKIARGPLGIQRLYKNFGFSVAFVTPYRAMYFGMYDTLAALNPFRNNGSNNIYHLGLNLVIAQATAIAASYVGHPLFTVRVRMESQAYKPKSERVYKSYSDCLMKMWRDEGLSAVFKNANAAALRTFSSALVLVIFDDLKQMVSMRSQPKY